ncbi:hypothetical protein MLD38_023342 [Melastoma candidum]|uniref:Uncharacterized protein n=1 Tax=Melastoma candidum TaxID=119954 RepID=A0ACB9QVD9_9MYRT|nr:hypothetical protein MLD38_023342 [Melastoma candidum]
MAGKEALGGGPTDRDRRLDSPPPDDVCPICFGDFSIPCRTGCGHWYCGSCILQLWKYTASSSPCKCPMCSRKIDRLTPLDTLKDQREDDVVKVLKEVKSYNLLHVGGARGLIQKAWKVPFYLKAYVVDIMDPDRPHPHFSEIRLVAMLLSALYMATPFDFIPTGKISVVRLFDFVALLLFVVLRLIGIFQRRRLARRVRELAHSEF